MPFHKVCWGNSLAGPWDWSSVDQNWPLSKTFKLLPLGVVIWPSLTAYCMAYVTCWKGMHPLKYTWQRSTPLYWLAWYGYHPWWDTSVISVAGFVLVRGAGWGNWLMKIWLTPKLADAHMLWNFMFLLNFTDMCLRCHMVNNVILSYLVCLILVVSNTKNGEFKTFSHLIYLNSGCLGYKKRGIQIIFCWQTCKC